LEDLEYIVKTGTATVEVKQNHRINIGKLLKIMGVQVGETVKITVEAIDTENLVAVPLNKNKPLEKGDEVKLVYKEKVP